MNLREIATELKRTIILNNVKEEILSSRMTWNLKEVLRSKSNFIKAKTFATIEIKERSRQTTNMKVENIENRVRNLFMILSCFFIYDQFQYVSLNSIKQNQ